MSNARYNTVYNYSMQVYIITKVLVGTMVTSLEVPTACSTVSFTITLSRPSFPYKGK